MQFDRSFLVSPQGLDFPYPGTLRALQPAAFHGASLRNAGPAYARPVDGARSGSGMCAKAPIDCARLKPRETTLSKSASRARLAEIIRKRSFGRGEITLASGRKATSTSTSSRPCSTPKARALLAELTC